MRKKKLLGLSICCALALAACPELTCSKARHRAIELLNLGVQQYSQNMPVEALRNIEAAVKEDPSFSKARFSLAQIYEEKQRWEDAQAQWMQYLTAEPEDAVAQYHLGVTYQMLGSFDRASELYKKATTLDANLYQPHFRLGTIAEVSGKPKEADLEYRQAIKLNPQFIKAFVKLGYLYIDYDYPDVALQVLKTGVALNSKNAEAYNGLGIAEQMLGNYSSAAENFDRALSIKPDLYDAMYNLGMVFYASKRFKEAEQTFVRFMQVAKGKANVDQEYIRAAQDKLASIKGDVPAPAALPKRRAL